MPTASRHRPVPSYRLRKARGCAVVTINGRNFYLGTYGSDRSYENYSRLIAEWKGGAPIVEPQPDGNGLQILELVNAYRKWAEGHYAKDGQPTSEVHCIRLAMKYLLALYATTPAAKFGPLAMKAVREKMIEGKLCRTTINSNVGRIRRMCRWGVENELIPSTVYHGLQAVQGLQRGRTKARETVPVEAVADKVINATLPHLPVIIADMVHFQRLVGCRPSEVCMVRPCDVDTSGEVWTYVPESHKTEHHGRERRIFIGPRAQDVLRPYLLRAKDSYCFSPKEAEKKRHVALREARKSKVQPSQMSRRKSKPKRKPAECYAKDSYRRAIARACEIAFKMPKDLRRIPDKLSAEQKSELRAHAAVWREQHVWSPNQLRHAAATQIRKRFGLEAAQVALGHSKADVTQLYAERDFALAERVMLEVG